MLYHIKYHINSRVSLSFPILIRRIIFQHVHIQFHEKSQDSKLPKLKLRYEKKFH